MENKFRVDLEKFKTVKFWTNCTYKVGEIDDGVRLYGDLELLYAGVDFDDSLEFEVYNQVYVALKMFLQQCRSCYLI